MINHPSIRVFRKGFMKSMQWRAIKARIAFGQPTLGQRSEQTTLGGKHAASTTFSTTKAGGLKQNPSYPVTEIYTQISTCVIAAMEHTIKKAQSFTQSCKLVAKSVSGRNLSPQKHSIVRFDLLREHFKDTKTNRFRYVHSLHIDGTKCFSMCCNIQAISLYDKLKGCVIIWKN